MDAEIRTSREEVATYKVEEKSLKVNFGALSATMTTSELQTTVEGLEQEKRELLSRLQPLKAGTVQAVSATERNKVEKDYKIWSYRAASRRKICMELWAILTQDLPEGKTKEELWVWIST